MLLTDTVGQGIQPAKTCFTYLTGLPLENQANSLANRYSCAITAKKGQIDIDSAGPMAKGMIHQHMGRSPF